MSRCERQFLTEVAPKIVVGVDGCPGGWFAIASTGQMGVYRSFQELLGKDLLGRDEAATYLIDIPIGLPNAAPRDLEFQARRLLTGKSSSVFAVPCRDAVYAENYQQACHINQERFGKKLSVQSWNICGKIREVDKALRDSPALSLHIYESHPELAFQQLIGEPLLFSKKTRDGLEERLQILQRFIPDARAWYAAALTAHPRKRLARDDITDAMVLMWVGKSAQFCLVDGQVQDEHKVPIRMLILQKGAFS